MKRTYIFLIPALAVILLAACGENPPSQSRAAVPSPDPGAACSLPVYALDNLPLAHPLDSTAVAALYIQATGLQQEFEFYSRYEKVYRLDSVSCGTFTLLSLYREDESGHHELYYLTLRQPARQLLSWAKVAAWGNDGNWQARCELQKTWARLRVTSVAQLSEENEGTQTAHQTTDSVVADYWLNSAGQLARLRVDSIHSTQPL